MWLSIQMAALVARILFTALQPPGQKGKALWHVQDFSAKEGIESQPPVAWRSQLMVELLSVLLSHVREAEEEQPAVWGGNYGSALLCCCW